MSIARSGAFCLRLSDGRRVDLPIGAKLTAENLPGLHSAQAGGAVARVTTHPTDPAGYGFQNLSQLPWRVRLPDGKKVEVAPGKNVRLVAGVRIQFGLVDGEVRLAGGWRSWSNKTRMLAGIGAVVVLCIIIFAAWQRSGRSAPVAARIDLSTPQAAAAPKVMTGPQIAKQSKPSVVTVFMLKNPKRKEISLGSGFIVARNLVVTNFHVIQGTQGGAVKFVGKETFYEARVIAEDRVNDLAVLRIEASDAVPLTLASDDPPEDGDDVYVIGSPEGFEATFSHGNVSAFRRADEGDRLQITASISHGSSGGPVLNAAGEVIGVSVAMLSEGQNINFAVPVKYIRKLLKSEHE